MPRGEGGEGNFPSPCRKDFPKINVDRMLPQSKLSLNAFMSWYSTFNGSHFGFPPSSMHRLTAWAGWHFGVNYLIITIICDYSFFAISDCNDFADINFCDFMKPN